jgi:hypothetical protein
MADERHCRHCGLRVTHEVERALTICFECLYRAEHLPPVNVPRPVYGPRRG